MKKENAKKLSLSKIKIANLSNQGDAKRKDFAPTTTVLLSRRNLC